jgi:hypothetical protein
VAGEVPLQEGLEMLGMKRRNAMPWISILVGFSSGVE